MSDVELIPEQKVQPRAGIPILDAAMRRLENL